MATFESFLNSLGYTSTVEDDFVRWFTPEWSRVHDDEMDFLRSEYGQQQEFAGSDAFGTAGYDPKLFNPSPGTTNAPMVTIGGKTYNQVGAAGGELLASSGAIKDPTYGWILPAEAFNALNAPSGFDRALGVVMPLVIGAGMTAGLVAGFSALAAAPATVVGSGSQVVALAAPGTFGGPPLFGPEHLAQDAFASVLTVPADVAGALVGPAAGTFAGPPLFGPAHLVQDAARAVFSLPAAPLVSPWLPGADVPVLPTVSDPVLPAVSDPVLPTVRELISAAPGVASAVAGLAGAAAAVKQLEAAGAGGGLFDVPGAVIAGPVPASLALGTVGLVVFSLAVIAAAVYLTRKKR